MASSGAASTALSFVVVVALGAGLWFAFRQRQATRRVLAERLASDVPLPPPPSPLRRARAASRPWWGNPWLWVVVCVTFAVLGLFVWPGLFGGTFLLLPFVWIWRPRREADMDPRRNGHAERDPESFTGD